MYEMCDLACNGAVMEMALIPLNMMGVINLKTSLMSSMSASDRVSVSVLLLAASALLCKMDLICFQHTKLCEVVLHLDDLISNVLFLFTPSSLKRAPLVCST